MILYPTDKHGLKKNYSMRDYSFSDGKCLCECERACADIFEKHKNDTISIRRALAVEYILTNARIHFDKSDLFVSGIEYSDFLGKIRYESLMSYVKSDFGEDLLKLHSDGYKTGAYTGDCDFGHNCPDYKTLFSLGIPGIIKLAEEKLKTAENTSAADLYVSVITVYKALRIHILRYARISERFADESENAALRYKTLMNIANNAPSNLCEAIQLQIFIFSLMYTLTSNFARSLGLIDSLLYPFYKKDLESGTFSENDIRAVTAHFLCHYYAMNITSNTPFYICGLDENEKDISNEFTRLLLDEYIALDINDPKIQVRYHNDISEDILKTIMKSIAHGRNSFVFVNDSITIKALEKTGASHKDAVDYALVGCYEPLCAGKEIAATCSGRVMLPKAIEYAFTQGIDHLTGIRAGAKTNDISSMGSFDEFYDAVKQQISHLCKNSIDLTLAFEKHYPDVNSAPFFAPLLYDCMNKGVEPYSGGARYNTTSVNAFGIATAADSLAAVKKAVFEDGTVSLTELYRILADNWNGNEKLRREILTKYPKYGNADEKADVFARELMAYCAKCINGVPNARGGVFRLGAFSIDWAFTFGAKTMATPDGRALSAPYSKNMCAVTAMDRKGATALIRSATSFDYTECPNGTVLDLMLHASAMSGDDGISAAVSLVKTFMKLGGNAIQINVFDPATLRLAQKMPEKYCNLQVRRCGWNVYFNELSRQEQDEFILQAENL